MSLAQWALVACVVFSGTWSGLLAMLTLVMHRMLEEMEGPDFARFLRRFLPVAREAPFNYAAIAGMVISPIVALIAIDGTGTPFVLAAIGLALTVAGPLLSSRFLAEPNYDVMLAWDPDSLPDGWEATRRRYFAINWLRAVITWIAFGVFLAALVEAL